jgi:tetratricopeptide (TPR) repeat protein
LSAYLATAKADEPNYEPAAYLRFKAAESVYLQADPADRTEAGEEYLANLRDFLQRAPNHPNAFEAWFRLGDWQREQQQYIACAESFAKVRGDAAFEIKASYLSAQCYVEDILARPDTEPASTDDVSRAVAALDGFLIRTDAASPDRTESQSALLAPLEAKAIVMSAAIVTRSGFGTMHDRLHRLNGFESRFPNEQALLPEVLSLRIVAYRTLGDLDQAGEALEALLTLEVPGAYRIDSLKKLGIVFLKEASKRDDESDTDGALRSRRVALRVYETLLADAKSVPAETEPLDGIERLVADLRRQTTIGAGD